MNAVKAKIRTQDTETILACILAMGGGALSTSEERLVRAALIDVYIERTSEEDGDALMDALGM